MINMIRLYHFTSINNLCNIIKTQTIKSSHTYCIKHGIYIYPSFTYSIEENEFTPTMLKTYGHGILKLNQSIIFENDWIGSDNQENKIHNYSSNNLLKLIESRPLKGEIVIKEDNIKLYDYLEKVYIPANMPSAFRNQILYLKSLNIPVIEYNKKKFDV